MKITNFLVSLLVLGGLVGGYVYGPQAVEADVVSNDITLSSVSPSSGPIGTTITLMGTGFTHLNMSQNPPQAAGNGAWFTNGTYSANLYNWGFKVLSDTTATAVVPSSLCFGTESLCNTEHYNIAPSGENSIYLKSNYGNVGVITTSSVKFTVTSSSGSVSLSSVSPTSGQPNSTITVKGSGFNSLVLPAGGDQYNDGIWFSNGNYSVNLYQSQFHLVDDSTFTAVVPNYSCPGGETNSCSSNFTALLPQGYYSIYVKTNNGSTVTNVLSFYLARVPTTSNAHPVGSNVKGVDGTVYFISAGGSRSPYTSAGAFLSYKFNNWGAVAEANTDDMNLPLTTYAVSPDNTLATYFIPPRNGSLINDHGTVYLITNGQRAGFTSSAVFTGAGYSFSNVYSGDTSFMVTLPPISSADRAHSDGTLINDQGTLYVIKGGSRLGFPSMAVLESWGYWTSDAVPANSYDRNLPMGGVVQARMADQLNI